METGFKSGRTGQGAAYVSDHSGSPHAKFMRLSSYALVPLTIFAAWDLIEIVGQPYEAARAVLGRPFPALVLVAFVVVGMIHARLGANEIIEDYVHDAELKEKALLANKWASLGLAVLWVFAILLIAAPSPK